MSQSPTILECPAPFSKWFLGLAGPIGAGKTTLAEALGKVMKLPVYYELVEENEYLESFYQDMDRYALRFQFYLLNERFRQHQNVIWSQRGGVADRTIYEDKIFAKTLMQMGHMEELDFKLYCKMFENMSNFMRPPTVIIYLDVEPEVSLQRIRQRGRGCESGITLDYLQHLKQGYDEFIQEIGEQIPVIRLYWNRFHSPEEVAQEISAVIQEGLLRRVHPLVIAD